MVPLIVSLLLLYPMTMAMIWMVLALIQASGRESRERWLTRPPQGADGPAISVLIPCFNEGPLLGETLSAALSLQWPDYEVIAINDGSRDGTGPTLEAWAAREPRLRVVHLAINQGKALALRAGALLARHELLLCIDADARLDPWAAAWMVRHFAEDHQLGAITGNPRIRNRRTLLGQLQVGEFSMIIGLIKRAQQLMGGLFCVSGVIAAFRRSALEQVGFWDPECLTEDIAITWKLQRAGWRVLYEPHALVWILMPETLGGLWHQRLRWAQGGLQVLLGNLNLLASPRQWRLLPLIVEPLLSLAWVYTIVIITLMHLFAPEMLHSEWMFAKHPHPLHPHALHGAILLLVMTALVQLFVSVWLDFPYDPGVARNGFWMIWYLLFFWLISFVATVIALPKVLLRPRSQRARWVSPDRALKV